MFKQQILKCSFDCWFYITVVAVYELLYTHKLYHISGFDKHSPSRKTLARTKLSIFGIDWEMDVDSLIIIVAEIVWFKSAINSDKRYLINVCMYVSECLESNRHLCFSFNGRVLLRYTFVRSVLLEESVTIIIFCCCPIVVDVGGAFFCCYGSWRSLWVQNVVHI